MEAYLLFAAHLRLHVHSRLAESRRAFVDASAQKHKDRLKSIEEENELFQVSPEHTWQELLLHDLPQEELNIASRFFARLTRELSVPVPIMNGKTLTVHQEFLDSIGTFLGKTQVLPVGHHWSAKLGEEHASEPHVRDLIRDSCWPVHERLVCILTANGNRSKPPGFGL